MDIPEFSTKPSELDVVKQDGPHSVLVRLHQHDWDVLKVMLKRDGLSFQKFVAICARGYLEADPDIIKCIRRYRTIEKIPEDQMKRSVFSSRERAEIYAELEKESKE